MNSIESTNLLTRSILALSICSLALLAPVTPSFASTGPDVKVTDGATSIVLDNGLARIEIGKHGGGISRLAERVGGQYVELADQKGMYFDVNGGQKDVPPDVTTKPPKAGYQGANIKSVTIVRNTPDLVEVAAVGEPKLFLPFVIELHYIMMRGVSGYYAYALFRHDASLPGGGIGQTRFVISGSRSLTDHAIDDARKGPVDRSPSVRTVSDATYLLQDGTIYCKYNNTCFMRDHHLHGMTGNGAGVWMVTPSNEYVNGGPIKQELTVHAYNSLLTMFIGGHYGSHSAEVNAGETWARLFGPILVYMNQGATTDDMYADAKRQAAEEMTKWPYTWVNNPEYPVARGTVTGTIRLTDGESAQGATAVLAAPGSDWALQANGYEFWSGVGDGGKFSIPKVRPGTYALYVYGANQFEQFEADNVTVNPDMTTDLGTLDWKPVKHGQTLWQIGTPDRTTLKYRGGEDNWGPNGMRHFSNFKTYPQNFPNDVTFVIGKSHEATDWNYAQWTWYCKKPYWSIDFTLPSQPKGTMTLTLGIAGSCPANGHETYTNIGVNGHNVADLHLPKTGPAAYRSGGNDSEYQIKYVTFDASLLKAGDNEITLGDGRATPFPQSALEPAEPTAPEEEQPAAAKEPAHTGKSAGSIGAVMYDSIRLEVSQ